MNLTLFRDPRPAGHAPSLPLVSGWGQWSADLALPADGQSSRSCRRSSPSWSCVSRPGQVRRFPWRASVLGPCPEVWRRALKRKDRAEFEQQTEQTDSGPFPSPDSGGGCEGPPGSKFYVGRWPPKRVRLLERKKTEEEPWDDDAPLAARWKVPSSAKIEDLLPD